MTIEPKRAVSSATAQLRLLVAEGSEADYARLLDELRRDGYELVAERVSSAEALGAALERPWDLIVSDWSTPGLDGVEVLAALAARRVSPPCIIRAGALGEEAAVHALRAGAYDLVSKDQPGLLSSAVQRALREAAVTRARVEAEHELRLSEERYRRAFDITPEIVLTFETKARRIIDANASALRFFRVSLEALRATPMGGLSPLVQPDGRASVDHGRDIMDRATRGLETCQPWTFLIGGELVPAEITVIPLPTSSQNLARVSIIDLRERLRLEESRRRTAELEVINRRIAEASRLKSEFLANMSHELRTPLNAIIGFAELLYGGHVAPGSAEHREFLADILTSGRHLLQLINDILDLSKVESGRLEFRPAPVTLVEVLGEVAAVLRTIAASKRLRVEVAVDPAVAEVVLDEARLKQVAYNYLSNALKFTPAGGRVIARVTPEGPDRFRLEVEDTGIGIAPEDLDRLFIEFQQLEAGAARPHQGTGLGLALTRRIVEAQGGTVGVRSAVGRGSTFHAILPRRGAVTPHEGGA